MTNQRKETRKYVFTVEGETEQWYLEWLRDQINACPESRYNVSIVSKVQQNPKKYAKTVNPMATPKVTHICDYESNEDIHTQKFQHILSELRDANSVSGRKFKYKLGYSNFTFELWIILHKQMCNAKFTHRSQYLQPINRAFNEHFENLDQYKHEANFKRCLSNLTLDDVISAIRRSERIMRNKVIEEKPIQYKKFSYYTENPALTVWESIRDILLDCCLLDL